MDDIILKNFEELAGLKPGECNPVTFDFRLDPTAEVFTDFGRVLLEANAVQLPFSPCRFNSFMHADDGYRLPFSTILWEEEGMVNVVLFSQTHGEPFFGFKYDTKTGAVGYCTFSDLYAHVQKDMTAESIRENLRWVLRHTMGCLAALATKGVSEVVEQPNARQNKKREARGQRPLPERHLIFVDGVRDVSQLTVADGDTSRASPRAHYRRGHIRSLPDGRMIPVRAAIVAGTVATPKQYQVGGKISSPSKLNDNKPQQ